MLPQAKELVVLGFPLSPPSQRPPGARNRELIEAAIKKFWRATYAIRDQIQDRGVAETKRIQRMCSCVLPVLVWGIQAALLANEREELDKVWVDA